LIYDPLDGTSFATPHAAGLAARILSELRANPGRYPQVAGLSRPEIAGYVRNLLFTRTTDVGSVGFDRETGHGIPDLAAIFEQLQADATPSAFQMKQTIQEWNDPIVFGNPFLSQYLARTQASNPLTRIALNYTFSRGSCASTSGKLSIDKPKLDVSIAAFQGAITSMTADTVTMDVSYDLRVPVRIEIDYLLPFVTCVLPIPIHVTVTGDWRSPQTGYTNTMRVVFKLDGEGYRAEDVSITGPETKQIFVGYSGVPAIFNSFLSQYDTQLREFATPAVQLFEEGVNDHVVQMLERMLNGTLSAERQEPFDYFRFRRPEPQGNLPLSLDYFTTRDRHDHLAAIGSNQSVFPVIASGLPGMTATSPVPDPTLGANPADVAQAIEKNTYGFELDYLWRSGVFDSITNDQLMAAIRTTTESQPDGANAVSVRVDNVLLVAPPALVPDRSVPGFFGRLQLIAVADVTVDNDPPSTVVFIYAPFVSEYSMFKEYARESDFTTFPLDLRWEDRLVVDPFQVAPTNAQPVFELLGFPEVPSQVDPTLPVISTAEVSEVMRATILSEYHRALGSMSTKRLGLDARLGEGWGCFAPVVDFVNQYAQQLTGNDFLKLRGIQGCWDLNLGVFGPERTTQVRELTDHLVQDDTLNPRRTPEDLVPTAANPTPFFMTHPRDARFQAAVLPVAYSAMGSQPDFFYSVNGEWNTPPGAQTNMQAVEEVWQAVLRRAAGVRFVYVPEKTAFAPGEKTTFELLGAARDSAPAQLEVGSCWVRFRVEFAHARQPFAAIGPSNTQPVAAENYAQTRVDTPNDAWQNIQACDGWGSGEPTEPVDPDLQVGN
ncbi:MAG: S8 family serine peptidase, partial [Myxococcales bacterium]|nr:S8 family serine peptidase [Myxococcales bacterium]